MKTSDLGKQFIKSFEKCRLTAYPDPATGGAPWTIGWGHTSGVRPGMVCTQQQADAWFDTEIVQYENDVTLLVKVPVKIWQFDSLSSFAYNVGPDMDHDGIAEGLGDSTLLKLLNAGNYSGAAAQFDKWNRGPNGPMAGLTARRAAERQIFDKNIYAMHDGPTIDGNA